MGIKSWFFNKNAPAASVYNHADIAAWLEIWQGGGDWRYTNKGGLNGGTRRVASLNAARAVCAELARLCCAEGVTLSFRDAETEAFVNSVLENSNFSIRFPEFMEKAFALGGGAISVFTENNTVKLDFISADRFIPTRWNSCGISGAVTASIITQNSTRFTLAQKQELTSDGYEITNRLFNENGAPAELKSVLPSLCEKSVIKGLEKPLFVYFRTGCEKSGGSVPTGVSVFSGAVDTVKSIDMVFDSLNREFILGRKRIIVPSYAIRGEYDDNGELRRYFDVNDEVFQALSASDTDELKITDNTAALRVTEHLDALSALLDTLCMQTGLSEGALSYKNGSIRTATEVISRNSRSYRTRSYYRQIISQGMARVAENICILGKMCGLLGDNADSRCSLIFSDGAEDDESTRTDRAIKLYSAGIISRTRAISQIYGISMEEACEMERRDYNNGGEYYRTGNCGTGGL